VRQVPPDESQLPSNLLRALESSMHRISILPCTTQRTIASTLDELATRVNAMIWDGCKPIETFEVALVARIPHERIPNIDGKGPTGVSPFGRLSDAEKGVASLVKLGRSNKAIALELGISRRTVEAHLTRIFRKLKIESRLQLALIHQFDTTGRGGICCHE
jgi:DNA-binding NarL/FixJ family response regulator